MFTAESTTAGSGCSDEYSQSCALEVAKNSNNDDVRYIVYSTTDSKVIDIDIHTYEYEIATTIQQDRSSNNSVEIDNFEDAQDTDVDSSDNAAAAYLTCEICILVSPDLIESAESRLCYCIVCDACVKYYINNKVKDGNLNMHCPVCLRAYEASEIATQLSESGLKTYKQLRFNNKIQENPHARFCPSVDCNGVVYRNMHTREKEVTCNECKVKFCFDCSEAAHGKGSCNKAIRYSLTYRKFAKYKKKHTKQCPACNYIIEKVQDGSCNHMICSNCKTEFCWLCTQCIPPEGHFDLSNQNGCPGMQFYDSKSNGIIVTCRSRFSKRIKAFGDTFKAVGKKIIVPGRRGRALA